MANEHVVKVRLSAQVAEYSRAMEEAAKKTRETGSEAEKLAQQKEAFQALGTAAAGMGTAISVAVSMAVAKYAAFDQQMSYVQAATHETAENMDLLRDAALEAGSRTAFSATEAAAAIEELSKAGVSTADILDGALDGALDAAAAGGMEVAATAELMASTLSQFNLEGSEASHVADLLAAGAGKAQGGMSDLGEALNQAGLVSNQFGLSVEDTVGTLAAFANAGMMGSDAGTSLRTMLLRLANPTGEVKELMEGLGIAAYDSQGDFVGLDSLAGQLQQSLGGMTQAQRDQTLAMIFGQDAIRGANILMNEGTEGIREWTDAVNDQGYAQETASIRLDNLKGDWEAFTGALETGMIAAGEAADGPLRMLVQGLTGVVDTFNSLPDVAKQASLVIAGVGGAAMTAGGLALLALPKLVELNDAINVMSGSSRTLRSRLGGVASFLGGPWGIALGGATAIVATLATAHVEGERRARSYADTLDETTGSVTDATRSMAVEMLTAERGFLGWSKTIADMAEEADVDLGVVTDAILGNADAYAELEEAAARMTKETGDNQNWATSLKDAVDAEISSMERARDIHEQTSEAIEGSTEATEAATEGAKSAAEAYLEEAGSVEDLTSQLDQLISKLMESNDVNQDAITAQSAYEETLDAVEEQVRSITDGVEGYAATLDLSTEAGRANMAMLQDQARDAQAAAEAQFALDGNTQAYIDRLRAGRETFIENAQRLGATREEALALADQIYAIPSEKEVKVLAETAAAQKVLDEFVWSNDGRTITMKVQTPGVRPSVGNDGGPGGFADGGIVEHTPFGPVEAFANGGIRPGIYAGGPPILKFAEPETRWEAFISGKPSERERNVGVWVSSGDRLGVWDELRDALGNLTAATASGQNPLVGNLTLQSSGDFREDVREVNFQLRALQRGGRR